MQFVRYICFLSNHLVGMWYRSVLLTALMNALQQLVSLMYFLTRRDSCEQLDIAWSLCICLSVLRWVLPAVLTQLPYYILPHLHIPPALLHCASLQPLLHLALVNLVLGIHLASPTHTTCLTTSPLTYTYHIPYYITKHCLTYTSCLTYTYRAYALLHLASPKVWLHSALLTNSTTTLSM